MSLDVYLMAIRPTRIYSSNITHNLGAMAEVARVYDVLWRADEIGLEQAGELIMPLRAGLKRLLDAPEVFKKMNPENGWGSYEGLVKFVTSYLAACEENPDAEIRISR